MNNQNNRNIQNQAQLEKRSRIIQASAGNLEQGAETMQYNTNHSQQCIIVMIKRDTCCCCFYCCTCKLDVPANFIVLEEDCGSAQPLMTSGAHWCYCCNKRPICMLTKNIINYDAPVKFCPTKDNAYVDIDIHFTFRLPQTDDLVKTFVYKLGAGRFDELLAAEVEENIRIFINSIWLNQVLDLKSDMALAMLTELNRKFQPYGIIFDQCNVTNVIVNPQLSNALQQKTIIKYGLQNHIKDQENKRLTIENEEQQKLTTLQRDNERKMYQLHQQIERAKIDKEQSEIQAQTQAEIQKVKSEEQASVRITQAQGQQQIVVNQVKAETVTKINNAKAAAQKMLINTEQQVRVMGIEAQTELEKVKAKYTALIQECDAESQNLEAINAGRQHNYEMSKANAFEQLADGNTKIVMSGSQGENLINKIFQLDK